MSTKTQAPLEWTPVEQDLPPTILNPEAYPRSKEVLVYYSEGEYGIAHTSDYGEGIEWYDDAGDNVTDYVTHWCDLLEAPTKAVP